MSFISVEKISSKEAWKIRGILFATIIFASLITIFYPYNILKYFFPDFFNQQSACIMLNVFGIPCPFCGMSHSLNEFIHFNFTRSIYYNPSSVIFFPFLAFVCLSIFILSLFNYKISVKFNKNLFIIAILLLFVIWVLNIFFGHLS